MRVIRSGQPIRMHGARPGASDPEEHTKCVRQLQPAHYGRAGNHDPQGGQFPQSVRRSVQVLMSLLSERDRQTVRSHLAGLTHDVTVLFFTQTIAAPETALIARQVIDEVVSLSDRITVEEVNQILDKERSA